LNFSLKKTEKYKPLKVGVGRSTDGSSENRGGARSQTLSKRLRDEEQRLRAGLGQLANLPKLGAWEGISELVQWD
jgi:hypothetical protein